MPIDEGVLKEAVMNNAFIGLTDYIGLRAPMSQCVASMFIVLVLIKYFEYKMSCWKSNIDQGRI